MRFKEHRTQGTSWRLIDRCSVAFRSATQDIEVRELNHSSVPFDWLEAVDLPLTNIEDLRDVLQDNSNRQIEVLQHAAGYLVPATLPLRHLTPSNESARGRLVWIQEFLGNHPQDLTRAASFVASATVLLQAMP